MNGFVSSRRQQQEYQLHPEEDSDEDETAEDDAVLNLETAAGNDFVGTEDAQPPTSG